MKQEAFVFEPYIPDDWSPAERSHLEYMLEKSAEACFEKADYKGCATIIGQLSKMRGFDAAQELNVSVSDADLKTPAEIREELEAELRERGINPRAITAELFK